MAGLIAESVPEVRFSELFSLPWFSWSRGEYVHQFEERFASYIGVKHAIALPSARYGLTKVYSFFGCKKVALPSYTCVPVGDSVRWSGSSPLFADVSLDTYNPVFEPSLLRKADGVVPTYLYGLVQDTSDLTSFCSRKNIPVIEDAAIALGGQIGGRKVGSLGDAGVFSLQSSKVITGWRGGVVTTNNDKLASYLRSESEKLSAPSFLRTCASVEFTHFDRLLGASFLNKYTMNAFKRWMVSSGKRGEAITGDSAKNMPTDIASFSNLQAKTALNGLKRIDSIVARRREIAEQYIKAFSKQERICTPPEEKGCTHAYGRFPIRIKGLDKMNVQKKLFSLGVEVSLNYPYVIPETKHFKKSEYGSFPNASVAARETFLLPVYPSLSQKQIAHVIDAVLRLI